MKLALISDIHANREAFEACLDHARRQGASNFALLGDLVGYGADPAWVVDRVRELVAAGAHAVLGNHDAAILEGPSPLMHPEAQAAARWTRHQLDAAQQDFLAGLPETVRDGNCLFVHANPVAPRLWNYVSCARDAAHSLDASDCTRIFCGHVHDPAAFCRIPGAGVMHLRPTAGTRLALRAGQAGLFIAGAAGQPRDGNPAACYALFDRKADAISFHRVPYDHARAAAKILDAGLPARLALRLHEGC